MKCKCVLNEFRTGWYCRTFETNGIVGMVFGVVSECHAKQAAKPFRSLATLMIDEQIKNRRNGKIALC